jgi:hypothetical protein
MRSIIPENGYESPRLPDNDGALLEQAQFSGERRRPAWTRSGDQRDEFATTNVHARPNGGGGITAQNSDEEVGKKSMVGFRDRVGCFTWTWFTMTMATGGIASVIHSSNAIRPYNKEFSSNELQSPTLPTG